MVKRGDKSDSTSTKTRPGIKLPGNLKITRHTQKHFSIVEILSNLPKLNSNKHLIHSRILEKHGNANAAPLKLVLLGRT